MFYIFNILILCCGCSVTKLCLHDPMDCSTPGFPVPHNLSEFVQVHVHCIGDAVTTISSSVTLFSSCPQSFLALRSFPLSWLFPSGSQSIGASASASVLPMNSHCWFPLGLTGLISLLPKGFMFLFLSVAKSCLNLCYPVNDN